MRAPTFRRLFTGAALGLGIVAVCCLSLQLSAFTFDRLLDSDLLSTHVLCTDLLSSRYPVFGWTLSSAPSFFPDLAAYTLLLALCGDSGITIPLYVTLFYLGLFIVVSLCLRSLVDSGSRAFLLGVTMTWMLLLLQFLPEHACYLAWLGIPLAHGGVLLAGFAVLWLVNLLLRGWYLRLVSTGLFFLSTAMLASDSLYVFQVLLPVGLGLYLLRKLHPRFQAIWRLYAGLGVASGLGALLIRALCHAQGWFHFRRILRYAPTLANQWSAFQRFTADFQSTLLPHAWAFLIVAAIAGGAAWTRFFRPMNSREVPAKDSDECTTFPSASQVLTFYQVSCWASLFIMLPLPILTCYWKDAQNARYLLNWIVLPSFLLGSEVARTMMLRRPVSIGHKPVSYLPVATLLTAFSITIVCCAESLKVEQLLFPYPPAVAELDRFLADHHLKYGLANSWNSHYPNLLSRQGVQISQIRKDGTAYFWDNNTFRYYEPDAKRKFVWPDYTFVLANDLHEAALAQRFGEPVRREPVGPYTVLLYDKSGREKIRASLEPEIRQRLHELGRDALVTHQAVDEVLHVPNPP